MFEIIKQLKQHFKSPKRSYYLGIRKYGAPYFIPTKQIAIKWYGLGWKDKFMFPRYEYSPAFHIFFFKWQFSIHWYAPFGDNDDYWEMVLWTYKYCKGNIKLARKSWGWIDNASKESTWNPKYLK